MILHIENLYPQDFADAFFRKADFDLAWRTLSGKKDFSSDALRGYIRAIQLRFEEAWDCFDKANKKSEKCEQDLKNLTQCLLLHVCNFYCALWEADTLNMPRMDQYLETLQIPHVQRALQKYPIVVYAIQMQILSGATLLLLTRRFSQAMEKYNLILKERVNTPEHLPSIYLGIAACLWNLYQRPEAQKFFENAELATTTLTDAFWRLQASAMLMAAFGYIQNSQKVDEWRTYLWATDCPEQSKKLFVAHSVLMHRRCLDHRHLVVL